MSDLILGRGFVDFDLFSLDEDTVDLVKNMSGSNQKGIIVVYSYEKEDNDNLKAQLTLLEKIFEAIKFDLNRDAGLIAKTPKGRLSYAELMKIQPVNYMICFGISPMQVGLNIETKPYEAVTLGKTTFLFSDKLQDLMEKKEKKRDLWMALKATFLN